MPTYALLGATGSTGKAIVRHLLTNAPQDLSLNIFVRSKSKLLATFPDVERTTAFQTTIFEGTISDTSTLRQCLDDVDVVLGCIGTNEPTPGMTLVEDTIKSVIVALEWHGEQKGKDYKVPTVIQLRSSSLNEAAALPWVAKQMAWFFFYHIYTDLKAGCDLLVSSAPQLLHYIFVDPPSIHDADGTTPTGYRLLTGGGAVQEPAISYTDLGAGFCEIAARREEFGGLGVLVSATGEVKKTWGTLMGFMGQGLKSRVWG